MTRVINRLNSGGRGGMKKSEMIVFLFYVNTIL